MNGSKKKLGLGNAFNTKNYSVLAGYIREIEERGSHDKEDLKGLFAIREFLKREEKDGLAEFADNSIEETQKGREKNWIAAILGSVTVVTLFDLETNLFEKNYLNEAVDIAGEISAATGAVAATLYTIDRMSGGQSERLEAAEKEFYRELDEYRSVEEWYNSRL